MNKRTEYSHVFGNRAQTRFEGKKTHDKVLVKVHGDSALKTAEFLNFVCKLKDWELPNPEIGSAKPPHFHVFAAPNVLKRMSKNKLKKKLDSLKTKLTPGKQALRPSRFLRKRVCVYNPAWVTFASQNLRRTV